MRKHPPSNGRAQNQSTVGAVSIRTLIFKILITTKQMFNNTKRKIFVHGTVQSKGSQLCGLHPSIYTAKLAVVYPIIASHMYTLQKYCKNILNYLGPRNQKMVE